MAAYRFFFLSGHKLFLNFRRTLNLRSLTRTWFLKKLDLNHCRELQGHRGNKRVNKRHGTCLDRKHFSPRRANEEASHLFVISKKKFKKKKEEEHFHWNGHISLQWFFFQWLRLNDLLQMLWLSDKYSTFPFLSPRRLLHWVELLVVKLQSFVNLLLRIVYNCYLVLTVMHIICLGWLL